MQKPAKQCSKAYRPLHHFKRRLSDEHQPSLLFEQPAYQPQLLKVQTSPRFEKSLPTAYQSPFKGLRQMEKQNQYQAYGVNPQISFESSKSTSNSSNGDEVEHTHQVVFPSADAYSPSEGYGYGYSAPFGQGMADSSSFLPQSEECETYCEATRGGKRKNFKNAEERIQFRNSYEIKKKTELCRNFELYGKCKFGDACSYAHGRNELQKKTHVPTNFKTKLCTQFHEDGYCMYGDRCQFLHSIYDLKSTLTYKQGLKEGARLTLQRYEQMCIGEVEGAEILWANLVTGKGCGAPERRLDCFERMYNKEAFLENKRRFALEKEQRHAQNQMGSAQKGAGPKWGMAKKQAGFSYKPFTPAFAY